MDLNQVWIVLAKELTDLFRDRRSTLLMILTPVALALLYFFSASYSPSAQLEKQREAVQEIAILGREEQLAEGWAQLLSQEGLAIKRVADPERALAEQQLAAVLVLPEDFSDKLNRGESATIVLKFDALRIESQIAREKLKAFLREYEGTIITRRLADRNLPLGLLKAVDIREENVTTHKGVAWVQVGLILSFFLIGWGTVSVFNIAADLTAREKERGTLEALLVTSTDRLTLVLGKFLATLVVTLCTMISGVIALWFLVQFYGPTLLPQNFLRSFTHVLSLKILGPSIVVATFTMVLMSALGLALCLRARSSREAHSYSMPIFLGVTFTIFFVEFREVGIALPVLAIPVYNSVLVLRELSQGEFDLTHLGATLSILVLWAAIALWLAMRAFNSEKVLFRQ